MIDMSILMLMFVVIFCICLVKNRDFPATKMGQCMIWIMAVGGLLFLALIFCG